MTETAGLARLDALAQRYGARPSVIAGIGDPYVAYCVDEACALASGDWRPREEPAPPPEQRVIGGVPLLVGTIRTAEG